MSCLETFTGGLADFAKLSRAENEVSVGDRHQVISDLPAGSRATATALTCQPSEATTSMQPGQSQSTHGSPRKPLVIGCAALSTLLLCGELRSQSLRGSGSSMERQVRVARQHDFTYLRNASHVERFVDAGYLMRVSSNRNFELAGVSFPYARPEIALFVERLSRQYRSACGERLVVTSLTRPRNRQPPNASSRSVHQTGMAVDLRRSRKRSCRIWLERVLLDLERKRVLEATYEPRPPHYHIAVFPTQYRRYVETLTRDQRRTYRVARGDTLWDIAREHRTSVRALRRTNSLRGSRIRPGQVLQIPD